MVLRFGPGEPDWRGALCAAQWSARASRSRAHQGASALYTRCQTMTTGTSNSQRLPLPAPHFPSDGASAIVCPEGHVGDRSPKSKERDQKQKNAAKADSAAQARSKQDSQSRATQVPGKAKK